MGDFVVLADVPGAFYNWPALQLVGKLMAKKNVPAGADSARLKAQQLREAQAKADKRTRNIIIAVVAVLAVAIVAAIVLVIVNRPTTEKSAEGLPAQFQDGAPIVVSADGVSTEGSADETLDFYFDYTCQGCVITDYLVGPTMFQAAEAGDFNVAIHPVMTHNLAFNTAATAASLQVVADAPELFVPLHQAMVDYYYNEVLVPSDATVAGNLDSSTTKVAEIAREVGVPDDVIAKFDNEAASAYLLLSSQAWTARQVEGRSSQITSPEFVFMDTKLNPSGETSETMFASLLSEMDAVRTK